MKIGTAIILISLMALLYGSSSSGQENQTPEYEPVTNGELLDPCIEGSSDARHGVEILQVCERYIRGFIETMDWAGTQALEVPVCIPKDPDRVSQVRRAFMKWATHNLARHEENAISGLLAAIRAQYPCAEAE